MVVRLMIWGLRAVAGLFAVLALAAAGLFVFYQPFVVPTASMAPAIMAGDYILVARHPYTAAGGVPRAGDVVVFSLPRDAATRYVKRVIGLPGDKVRMVDGDLLLNGAPVGRVADGTAVSAEGLLRRFVETLPNGAAYTILTHTEPGSLGNTPELEVPAGHVFVVGDNRDNSLDSRAPTLFGFIPLNNLVGRVDLRMLSLGGGLGFGALH